MVAAAPQNPGVSAPVKARRRGAAPKYDWPEIEIFVFELMEEEGEFREWDVDSGWCTRADLERKVLAYFNDRVSRKKLKRSPGESTVRQKVAFSLAKWRSTQKANIPSHAHHVFSPCLHHAAARFSGVSTSLASARIIHVKPHQSATEPPWM
jgi:hypothetical protein